MHSCGPQPPTRQRHTRGTAKSCGAVSLSAAAMKSCQIGPATNRPRSARRQACAGCRSRPHTTVTRSGVKPANQAIVVVLRGAGLAGDRPIQAMHHRHAGAVQHHAFHHLQHLEGAGLVRHLRPRGRPARAAARGSLAATARPGGPPDDAAVAVLHTVDQGRLHDASAIGDRGIGTGPRATPWSPPPLAPRAAPAASNPPGGRQWRCSPPHPCQCAKRPRTVTRFSDCSSAMCNGGRTAEGHFVVVGPPIAEHEGRIEKARAR